MHPSPIIYPNNLAISFVKYLCRRILLFRYPQKISKIKPDDTGDFATLQEWADWIVTQKNPNQWAEYYGSKDLGSVVMQNWEQAKR